MPRRARVLATAAALTLAGGLLGAALAALGTLRLHRSGPSPRSSGGSRREAANRSPPPAPLDG